MPKVLDNQQIGPANWKMTVHVPKLVAKAKAGQFVIIRVNDSGERLNGFIDLAHQFPNARLVFTGGSASIRQTNIDYPLLTVVDL